MHKTHEELVAVQEQMELESLSRGVDAYRKMLTKGEANLPPGQKLVKAEVRAVATAITEWLDGCSKGLATRSFGAYYFLQQFTNEPDIPAFITCRHVFDTISITVPVQTVARKIAETLEDQVNHAALKATNPRAYRLLLKKIEKTDARGYRCAVLHAQQRYVGIKTFRWSASDRVKVGMTLIEIMRCATKRFDIVRQTKSRHSTPLHIVATKDTLDWLEISHKKCEMLSPDYTPMVVKPRPWTTPVDGGYLNPKMRKPIIKGANHNLLEELRHMEMPMVYRALNAMQDTEWTINTPIFRIMQEAWEGGGYIGGLPQRDQLPLPARDFTDKDADDQTPKFKAWKKRAAEVYSDNIKLVSQRIALCRLLVAAEQMGQFDKFHFVHNMDFRGRAYAISAFLNPQGDDTSKALLKFAKAKPLGDNGAFWLAVHGANCFGVDKVSFDERVTWVQDNHDAIIESADRPLDGARFWSTAEHPWQFLAFCIEWRNLDLWSLKCDSQTFESSLPVGMDGACNGLQNFSAMLRDEVGGKATNLVPSDTPSDIYAHVAAVANDIAARDTTGDPMAQKWAGKINRKLTKRNTMTVPYSVTQYGMGDQLLAEFKKLREKDPTVDPVVMTAAVEDAIYLANVNHAAIGQVVVAAYTAMAWLREVATVVAAEGLPIHWTTPSGLKVVQDYRESLGDVLDLVVAGRRFQMMLTRKGDKINRRRQSSGISPNFVHSLDAAHLQRTVGYCLDEGITSFAMVHDSYGTLAADVEALSQQLRQAFVDQYQGDVLGDFRTQMVESLKNSPKLVEKLPPCPPMGDLELADVLTSDYFFA